MITTKYPSRAEALRAAIARNASPAIRNAHGSRLIRYRYVRSKGPFLRRKIPWSWLYAAGRLPGKALHVGLLLWDETMRTNCRNVYLDLNKARPFGIHKDTVRRALAQLRKAGLIHITLRPGKPSEIILIDAQIDVSAAGNTPTAG